MLGIHPLRWVRRLVKTTVRRAVVVGLVATSMGVGGVNATTDGALGREAAAFVTTLMRGAPPPVEEAP